MYVGEAFAFFNFSFSPLPPSLQAFFVNFFSETSGFRLLSIFIFLAVKKAGCVIRRAVVNRLRSLTVWITQSHPLHELDRDAFQHISITPFFFGGDTKWLSVLYLPFKMFFFCLFFFRSRKGYHTDSQAYRKRNKKKGKR